MMKIIYGYIGVVARVLEIFGELGGWSIFKRLGVFKGIWNIFGVLILLIGST